MTDWRNMKIVAAACFKVIGGRPHGGLIFTLPPPARHHDILHLMHEVGIQQDHTVEQGFLTDNGRFVRRKPALMIAEHAGQLLQPIPQNRSQELFSEDVW